MVPGRNWCSELNRIKLLGVVLSPNTHWIWWYDVRSSLLVAFFSTLSQHLAIAMGMVESQKIRYPFRHPTVLQPISGLIPSLCSLSVTKFPYGNVDCALEKTPSAPSVFSLSALWVGDCNGKTSCFRFRVYGMFHVARKTCDELPVAFEAETCSIWPRTWTIMLQSAMHDLSYEACQAYGFIFTMRNPGAYFGNLANYVATRLGLSIVIVDHIMGDGESG